MQQKHIITICILVIISWNPLRSQCTHPDYDALMALYNSTGGDSWTNNTNWDSSCDPCDLMNAWHGVSCSGGRVLTLSLIDNNLTGPIPAEIEDLTELRWLDLASNNLNDVIPSSLYKLTKLTRLILSRNSLQGGISPTIANLHELEFFSLHTNNLIGTIPSEIGKLTQLETLSLHSNNFSGSIPKSFAALLNLESLYLGENDLMGNFPEGIFHLPELTHLSLEYNNIHFDLSKITLMPQLVSLVLNGINLNTSLPKDIGGLTQLQSLWLRDCNLSGSIPTSFGSLSNLTRVVLNENNIGGCWPQTMVGMCSQFTTSSFDDNLSSAISDGGWSYFCATSGSGNAMHPEYDAMVALYNALNGSGWDSDTGWDNGDGTVSCNPCDGSWQGVTCDAITKNVSEIDLSGNNLTGSIPPEIGDLLDLESLELSDNAITGVIPVEIGNLSKLEHLALATNSLVGPLPSSMRRLTNLSTLYINENNITGCWPSGWEDLCQEGTLVFADNNLSASISDSGWDDFCDDGLNTVHPDFDALAALYHSTGGAGWTHNTNWDVDYSCSDPCADAWFGIDCSGGRVITVDLGNNNLIGQIPEEIGDLFFLENLNLSQNSLTGSIPDEITDLNRLEEMSLTQNKLTGVIPSDLFTLPNLYFLNLSSNDLSGTLPLDISAGAMEVIDLSDNFLSGLVTRGFPNVIDNVDLSDNYFSSASPYFSWTYANDIDLSNNNLQGCFTEAWWALCSSGTSVDLSLNPGLGSLYNFCENGGQGGCSTCTDDDVSIGYEFFNIPHIGSSYHYTKVSNDITADVRIRDPKTVLFSAGNSIDLEAGFQVDLGAKFQAVIDECEFVEGTVISDTPISPIKK